jgi:general secretion pathway protein J
VTLHAHDGGFTLLELLVAVTLLALLSVALVAGLRFGTRIWDKAETSDVDTNAVRAAQKRVALDLVRIYPKLVVVNATDSFIDFMGTPQRMEFLSTTDRPDGQMTRIALSAANDDHGVTMQYDTLPELARTSAAGTQEMLLRHLRSIEFAYFGASQGEKSPAWHSTWQHEKGLPLLVRIRAATPHANVSFSEMVVHPKIAADLSCVYDPVVRTCQGRR